MHSLSESKPQVNMIMLQVLLALLPGSMAMLYYFGWGIFLNIMLAAAFACATEAVLLRLRKRPVWFTLQDNSALVSAWLFALTLPPLAPWWLVACGIIFAMLFGKHIYGGLGHNPFNPAMVGYAALLISFPMEMTRWLTPLSLTAEAPSFIAVVQSKLLGIAPAGGWDAFTGATPLDSMRTQLQGMRTIEEIRSSPLFGDFGGRGWEWIANWYAIGGLWLLYKRIISWHIPMALLSSLVVIAFVFYALDPDSHPSPGFHIFSGGVMLGAFFIATDPVSSCTSRKGKLIFGAGVGVLIYIIRSWGGYPDGVAFAVLLMNMAAPYIDYYSKPRVYGDQ